MNRFVNLICRITCTTVLCSVAVVAEVPSCPHSSAEIRAALDVARKSAEQASDQYVRSQLLHEVAKGYARDGDFEPALQVIRVDSPLMWQAADVLARNMLRCGLAPEVKALAPTLEGRSRSLVLQWLAEWQSKHDDPAGARETLSKIKDNDIRREAEFNIISFKALNGDAKTAEGEYRKLLQTSPPGLESTDDLVLQDMAVLYVMKGDVDAALESLDKMKGRGKVYALYTAVQVCGERKDKQGLVLLSKRTSKIAHQFLKDPDQAYPLSLLASAQAKVGMFDDAIELAKSIPDEQRKNEALVMIATHLIEAKDESRAKTLLDSLSKVPEDKGDHEAEREMAWVRIAMAQANVGKGEEALKSLDAVRDPRMQNLARWQRSYALAVAGRFAEARALAAQIPAQFPRDERGQVFRLIAAVNAHQKGGSEAMKWAGQLATPEDRTSAYLGIADGLLGEPTQAIPPYFQD
ncbi:MAG: tetratricopeptide repeat protein [Terriglobales bacterium]